MQTLPSNGDLDFGEEFDQPACEQHYCNYKNQRIDVSKIKVEHKLTAWFASKPRRH